MGDCLFEVIIIVPRQSLIFFLPQPLPRPPVRTPPPPFQYTETELHSACSCSQAQATVESVFPWTAASVMARPGTLYIATVTVLVILAAAVQPGEHYLTARLNLDLYNVFCIREKMFAYEVKQLVTKNLLHVLIMIYSS